MRFVLNGCDIDFTAEAPDDMTLKQLIEQCDRIKPHWCACGICSYKYAGYSESMNEPEIIFTYDDVYKAKEDISCDIKDRNIV